MAAKRTAVTGKPRKGHGFDFADFGSRLEAATRQAFEQVRRQHPDEKLVAFALHSDSGALTVCPSTNTASHLEAQLEEDLDDPLPKFSPAEWHFEMVGAKNVFNGLSMELRHHRINLIDDSGEIFESFAADLGEACISVLARLRAEGFFERVAGGPVLLVFNASAGDEEAESERSMIARLNGADVVEEHRSWTESWG